MDYETSSDAKPLLQTVFTFHAVQLVIYPGLQKSNSSLSKLIYSYWFSLNIEIIKSLFCGF